MTESNIYDMVPEDVIALVNEKTAEFVKVAENPDALAEFTSAMEDRELFNLYYAFEYLNKTDHGANYLDKVDAYGDRLYEALAYEMESRLGLHSNTTDTIMGL